MSIWGRLLGGAAGFALGGPIGAILGVMAGSAFDKKKQRSFNYSGGADRGGYKKTQGAWTENGTSCKAPEPY